MTSIRILPHYGANAFIGPDGTQAFFRWVARDNGISILHEEMTPSNIAAEMRKPWPLKVNAGYRTTIESLVKIHRRPWSVKAHCVIVDAETAAHLRASGFYSIESALRYAEATHEDGTSCIDIRIGKYLKLRVINVAKSTLKIM